MKKVNTCFLSLITLFLITLSSCSSISNSPSTQLREPSTDLPTFEPTDEVFVTSTSNVIITKTPTIIPISSPTLKVTLTEKYYFDTYNDCQENLLIINFVDSSIVDANFIYLPNVKQ